MQVYSSPAPHCALSLPLNGFVDVQDLEPGVIVDMPYASTNNFLGIQVYPTNPRALLRFPVAQALARVQRKLEKKGFGIKVWDAYRPFSIQECFWKAVPDPQYVAQPLRHDGELIQGSAHNRGTAVDVTLVDSHGQEVAMPTAFDDFSPRAHRDCESLAPEAKYHRLLLQTAMEAEGFIGLPTEWWHFDWKDALEYPLCDAPMVLGRREP